MSRKSNAIRAAIRRWVYPAPLVYKFAYTRKSAMSVPQAELYKPTPPDESGNWELVSVAPFGLDVVFWWKALADEGQPQGEE